MRYSDEDLESFLEDVESDFVERKESWKGDAPEKSRQSLCAFANDLPNHKRPGVLFVGAKDDGTPSGIAIDDRLLLTLSDMKTDGKILPPPSLTVEKRQLKGAELAVVTVQPAEAPPVRYDGRIWIRIGPRRGIASRQDELILDERRKYRDLPFDIQPVHSCNLSNLNRRLFEEEYLPNAFAADILAANERSYEERLASLKMIAGVSDPTPTVLGLLVLGKSIRDWFPGAYVQFLRIQGTEWDDPISDVADLDGPIGQVLRRLDEKIDAHNTIAIDIKSSSTERRTSLYPRAAIQQLTRNALMHRTYEGTNSPVKVYWFEDRIEIHSPGGPFGTVTEENFGKPGVTDYRNPHLAEALKVLGFVQRFGVGIATARGELRRNGNPELEFTVVSTAVMFLMRIRP